MAKTWGPAYTAFSTPKSPAEHIAHQMADRRNPFVNNEESMYETTKYGRSEREEQQQEGPAS